MCSGKVNFGLSFTKINGKFVKYSKNYFDRKKDFLDGLMLVYSEVHHEHPPHLM